MNGEDGLLAFVKARLEEGIEPPDLGALEAAAARAATERAARRRTRRFAWATAAAGTAAALALVCRVPAPAAPALSGEETVARVIDLLRYSDDGEAFDADPADTPLADRLLALQDAPYEHVLADLN